MNNSEHIAEGIKRLSEYLACAAAEAENLKSCVESLGSIEAENRMLQESGQIKTEFLLRLSHMLRTPLNSIKGAAYLLNRDEKQSPLQWDQYHDIISNETEKLIEAVENLLDFLRLKEEGPEAEPRNSTGRPLFP